MQILMAEMQTVPVPADFGLWGFAAVVEPNIYDQLGLQMAIRGFELSDQKVVGAAPVHLLLGDHEVGDHQPAVGAAQRGLEYVGAREVAAAVGDEVRSRSDAQ
jgi:hypothetical protein